MFLLDSAVVTKTPSSQLFRALFLNVNKDRQKCEESLQCEREKIG